MVFLQMKPIFRQNAAKVKQQYDKNLKLNIPIGDANGIVMSVWMFAVKPTLVVCTHYSRPCIHYYPSIMSKTLICSQISNAIKRYFVVSKWMCVMIAKTIQDLKNDKTLISRKNSESKFPQFSHCGTYFGSKVLCSFITQSVNVPIFAVHCLKNEKNELELAYSSSYSQHSVKKWKIYSQWKYFVKSTL